MLRDHGRSLSGLFAAGGVGERDQLIVSGGGNTETEFVHGQAVSGNFFSVLDVPARIGRTLTLEDDQAGNPQAVVVISHDYWERRFAADPAVIGRTVNFKGIPFTIVGVTPPGFFGFQPGDNPDLWWPLQMAPQIDRDPLGWRLKEGTSWLRLMGRLSAGVGQKQAEAELAVFYQRYRDDFAASRAGNWSGEVRQSYFAQKFELLPGHAGWTQLRGQFRLPLLILMAVVAMVLLIACANVASLMLARAAARAREFSMRSALGAGRWRLVRQLLTESVLLAALGGSLGLLFAQGGTRTLLAFLQLTIDPVSFSVTPDLRVLLFTTGTALLTGVLFGLAPALRSSRIDLASALKGAAGTVAGNVSRQRLNQERVVAQFGGFFGVSALVLACLGLYGVLSFDVVQRTREIGVRVALGAPHRNVLSLVVGQGLKLALAGAVVGIAGAFAATRLLANLLFGVTPTDPLTFFGVSIVLLLVAVLATWLPARRATRVDPMEALRYE
jgi:predicted permease